MIFWPKQSLRSTENETASGLSRLDTFRRVVNVSDETLDVTSLRSDVDPW